MLALDIDITIAVAQLRYKVAEQRVIKMKSSESISGEQKWLFAIAGEYLF